MGHVGLEVEEHLEGALRDLGLVGRVGGQELRPGHDRLHGGGNLVVIKPRSQKAGPVGNRLVVLADHVKEALEFGFGKAAGEG